MGVMINNGGDVITFLKDQHDDIKRLFARVVESRGPARTQAFAQLRKTLAVHETAEEEIVHPVARHALPDGEALVERRLKEENAAKKLLTELEGMDVDSPQFEARLQQLKTEVSAHADAEEREEFSRLAAKLDPGRLERMRKAAELAEAVAPTRAHPGLESATANLIVGPFAAMMDRARDVLASKH